MLHSSSSFFRSHFRIVVQFCCLSILSRAGETHRPCCLDLTHYSTFWAIPPLWYNKSQIPESWRSPVNGMAYLCSILLFLPHFTEFDDLPLSVSKTDMATIVKVMQLPDSGLEIRDRMWLKITIANAVIGLFLSLPWFEFVGWELRSLCLVYSMHQVLCRWFIYSV